MRLKNKICLVAGASSGMGRRTALFAGTQGATVVAAARRVDACEKVAAAIRDRGGDAWASVLDGTDPASVEALLRTIEERHGRLDCAFNNLGSTFGFSPVDETPIERWQATLETNLCAPFYLTKYEFALMKRTGGGVIINNSSSAGVRGVRAMADYSAAKWGLIGLTRSAALDGGEHGVRVNVIAPGIIRTEKFEDVRERMPDLMEKLRADIPGGEFGNMDDIAHLVAWLMSDEARYLNGATINVDGGQTIG